MAWSFHACGLVLTFPLFSLVIAGRDGKLAVTAHRAGDSWSGLETGASPA